jgi:L-malate glycosyltransferase
MNKLHVLIIPSWYPENEFDYKGSFFREQAIGLLEMDVKVGVIYPSLKPIDDFKTLRIFPKIFHENDNGLNSIKILWSNWFPKITFLQIIAFKILGFFLFKKYVKKFGKPDLIHCHSIIKAGFLAEKINTRYNIPFLITEHFSGFYNHVFKNYYNSFSRIFKKALRCYAVSSSFGDQLNDVIPNAPRFYIQHNLVNESFIKEKIKTKNKNNFVFLTIGNFTKNKNINLLISSFKEFNKIHSNSVLRIIGEGYQKKNLLELRNKSGIADKILFVGTKKREEIVEELNNAHIFLLASKVETFGVVLIEALAMGVPVISSKSGGSLEIVNDKLGILLSRTTKK